MQLYNLAGFERRQRAARADQRRGAHHQSQLSGLLELQHQRLLCQLERRAWSTSRSRAPWAAREPLTVQYRTADGTARQWHELCRVHEYLDLEQRRRFPAHRVYSFDQSPIRPGRPRTFTANLFNATLNGTNAPGLLGATTNAVFAIVNDNSDGTFQFSSPSYQFNDAAAMPPSASRAAVRPWARPR